MERGERILYQNQKKMEEFQQVIGYQFQNKNLLRQALTHSSYANEKHMHRLSDNETGVFR